MTTITEPDEQNDETLIEADADGPEEFDQVVAGVQPEVLEPEIVMVPDDDETRITGVMEDQDHQGEQNDNRITAVNTGSEDEGDMRIRSHSVWLKNPRDYNDGMINATILEEDFPEPQENEDNQPRMSTDEDVVTNIFEYLLTQYELMKGLRKYGTKGEEAAEKEPTQIHNMDALKPIDANSLSEEEKKRAIASSFFLTEKRDKARQYADGHMQRSYIEKENASSPTVTTEVVFTTCLIETKEGREVAVVDLPGAFLHADNEMT